MAECLPDIGEALGSIPGAYCPLFSFEAVGNAHMICFCLTGDSVSIPITWRLEAETVRKGRLRPYQAHRHSKHPQPGLIFS